MINFSGEHLERFKDGSLSIIFKDGKKNGAAILKDNYGNVQLHMNYVNDKLDGELRHYYNSGALMSSMYYSQGIRHGPSIIYYESGIVQMEVTYDTGKYNGILILYDEFGDKISETPYINGLKHGKNLNYYSKSQGGKVAELSYYENNLLVGDKITFSTSGKITSVTSYYKGRPQSYPRYF